MKYSKGQINQSSLATRLGVNRSVINRRLTGQTNMTIETLAYMVWALDQDITVKIKDTEITTGLNHHVNCAGPTKIPNTPFPGVMKETFVAAKSSFSADFMSNLLKPVVAA